MTLLMLLLVQEVVVEASPEKVWQAFTTQKGIESWLADKATVDLKLGGTIKADETTYTILSYETLKMLSYRVAKGTWTVVRFEKLAEKKTRVTMKTFGAEVKHDKMLARLKERVTGDAKPATQERILCQDAEIDAGTAELWAAFTTKKGMESWMVPVAQVNFKVGGTIKTNYNAKAKPGEPGWITQHILTYEARRMFSMRFDAPENAPVAKIAEATWTIVRFEPLGKKRTRVVITMLGWGKGEKWDEAYEFFKKGNAWELRQLQKHFPPE